MNYIVRKGTNARMLNHDKTPMIVEDDFIEEAIDYLVNVPAFRLQHGDLEAISVRDYIEKYERGVTRIYKEVKSEEEEPEEVRL